MGCRKHKPKKPPKLGEYICKKCKATAKSKKNICKAKLVTKL